MEPIKRFTTNFKNATQKAAWLSLYLQKKEVSSDLLFIALTLVPRSLANEILRKLKLSKEKLEDLLELELTQVEYGRTSKGQVISESEIEKLKLSAGTMKVIEKAALIAFKHKHKYVGTEHLLAALFELKNKLFYKVLTLVKLKPSEVTAHLDNVLKSTSKFTDVSEALKHPERSLMETLAGQSKEEKSALSYFATNLTADLTEKDFVLVGRDKEVDRLIHILARKNKNTPLLIGDPGVGKTAIVEGLAVRINQGKVPDILKDKQILNLDLSSVVAGTAYRGEFESRLRQIIEEVQENKDLILFIDEIHTMVGAGSAAGTLDAANILKPALARGLISCIGATTLEEYKKSIENDSALARRFLPIMVSEPSKQETLLVLKGVKNQYERYHRIKIENSALETAVFLADRYIVDKCFPDKAIDLIDEAASKLKVVKTNQTIASQVKSLTRELKQVMAAKEKAVLVEDFKKAKDIKKQEDILLPKIVKLRQLQEVEDKKSLGKISKSDIQKVVKDMVQVPFLEQTQLERNRILGVEAKLNQLIVGQEKVLSKVSRVLKRSHSGFADSSRPLASFVFLGPSGVGKTLTANAIAEQVFGSADNLIRIDMSEYAESFNVSKLIGAPAGYVGYKEGNLLADQVRKKPYSVVLFDEMEKGHPDIFNLLLQILEDGYLTDSSGRQIDFKHTIIILTSNIGLDHFSRGPGLGFGLSDQNKPSAKRDFKLIEADVLQELQDSFRLEFLNRIDQKVVFEPLSLNSLSKIVEQQLSLLNQRLSEQGIKVVVSPRARKHLAKLSDLPEQGARGVRSLVQEKVEDLLVDKWLRQEIKSGETVNLGYSRGDLVCN